MEYLKFNGSQRTKSMGDVYGPRVALKSSPKKAKDSKDRLTINGEIITMSL